MPNCHRSARPVHARVTRFQVAFDASQIGTESRSVLISELPIFLETVVDDFLKPKRQVGIEDDRRDGRARENRRKDHRRGLACKRLVSRECFVQHDSQREQVAPAVELFAGHLFRRHVRHSAQR